MQFGLSMIQGNINDCLVVATLNPNQTLMVCSIAWVWFVHMWIIFSASCGILSADVEMLSVRV